MENMDMQSAQQVMDLLIRYGTEYGLKVIGAIVILLVGRIAAGIGRNLLRKGMARTKVDEAVTSFLASLVYIAILTFAILAALAQFGIQTASFVAVLGAAAFAIGFALQGSLANFAAGVMILLFRPFRIGEFVEAGGVMGTIKEISLFTTVLATPDNVRIIVPNGQMTGGVIKNFSANDTRRVDLVVGIGYSSSIRKAAEIMQGLLQEDKRILADPAPTIAVAELGDSSVDFVVRPWVKKEDYWSVRFDFLQNVKERFDAEGIEIPFPQRTVHMVTEQGPV